MTHLDENTKLLILEIVINFTVFVFICKIA